MEKSMMKQAVRIEPEDNVAVAVQDIAAGEKVDCSGVQVTAGANISTGHKIAVFPIPRGENIVKYAVTIGISSREISPGEHVHSHNVEDITNQLCNEYERQFRSMKG